MKSVQQNLLLLENENLSLFLWAYTVGVEMVEWPRTHHSDGVYWPVESSMRKSFVFRTMLSPDFNLLAWGVCGPAQSRG